MGIEIRSEPLFPLRQYRCDVCGVTRSKRSLIQAHLQCHSDCPAGFTVIGNDQRRYSCGACGIVRSKLCLLRQHVLSHFPKPMEGSEVEDTLQVVETKKRKHWDCEECGLQVKKLANLRQHFLVHETQRKFTCPKDGCVKQYKRQDHLNRHLLRHENPKFQCSQRGCCTVCSSEPSLHRHLRRHHVKGILQRSRPKDEVEQTTWKCPEPNCPKVFPYRCRVQSHFEIAHEYRYSEILCGEPGCGERFSEASDLNVHIRNSHSAVKCEKCGVLTARKSYKRHLMLHEPNRMKCRLQCPFEDCVRSFANSSNLVIHVKVSHMRVRDYKCTKEKCGKVFGYKHTRDNHEKTGLHCYIQGDFLKEDFKFRSKARGGRKPVSLRTVDDLFRKRVVCPKQGERVIEADCCME